MNRFREVLSFCLVYFLQGATSLSLASQPATADAVDTDTSISTRLSQIKDWNSAEDFAVVSELILPVDAAFDSKMENAARSYGTSPSICALPESCNQTTEAISVMEWQLTVAAYCRLSYTQQQLGHLEKVLKCPREYSNGAFFAILARMKNRAKAKSLALSFVRHQCDFVRANAVAAYASLTAQEGVNADQSYLIAMFNLDSDSLAKVKSSFDSFRPMDRLLGLECVKIPSLEVGDTGSSDSVRRRREWTRN